jgi:hypothetical protein
MRGSDARCKKYTNGAHCAKGPQKREKKDDAPRSEVAIAMARRLLVPSRQRGGESAPIRGGGES